MAAWRQYLKRDQIPWLLEENNPSVRFYTLLELLNKDSKDPDVQKARKAIMQSEIVQKLLAGQNREGYWEKPERYYANFTGTAWRLILLAELGADPGNMQIRKAVEFLIQKARNPVKGGFLSRPENENPTPCYNARLAWCLIKMGYGYHPEVKKALEWACDDIQYNDGEKKRTGPKRVECWGPHSCIRGIIPNLKLFTDLPATLATTKVKKVFNAGIEYVLKHHVYKQSHNLQKVMTQKLTQLTFPSFYFDDFLEILLILTKAGCKDKRMEDAIDFLIKKQDKEGKWKMQRMYNERSKNDLFPVITPIEERGKPSKWITLRACIALKRYHIEENGKETLI